MKEANLHIEYSEPQFAEGLEVQKAIVRSLIYFDIFNYPLTMQEIVLFSPLKFNHLSDVRNSLDDLVESFTIFRFGEYYSLKNDESLIERRKTGNKMAAAVAHKLKTRSQFIHAFPFVRSVNISGSLSKNYFDETTDFDFFIITAPNRIWITRMLLTLYKKIFLLNHRKYFCINYYIDTEDLTIPDKNLFSATEIITLKNQSGADIYSDFIESNQWINNYFPNYIADKSHLEIGRNLRMKRRVENLLGGKFGDSLDTLCWKITLRFLKKRYQWLSTEEFNLNLRTKKHASKHHPQGFQFKVMKTYEEKCREFENKNGIKL